jgi:peptidoglycan pentaglycine glycine transferase (the first glycine)
MTDPPAPANDPWDSFVAGHSLATYLQLAGWARVKAANGWTSTVVEATGPGGGRIGARILLRRPAPMPWTFAYAPRGPLAERLDGASIEAWTAALRDRFGPGDVRRVAHVRIDPETEIGETRDGAAGAAVVAALQGLGWRRAPEVQPSVTRIVDLTVDEAALWSGLRSKWRQYVNKARTGGVTVADVDADADPSAFPTFHRIMAATSLRTRTPIRTEASYRAVWDAFAPAGGVRLLFARDASGDVQGVLMLVRTGTRVVEPYGGMTAAGADSRANYLLKWHAMLTSREQGASSYDMWGLVHPGIRQFKEGFGGREVTFIGAWDLPIRLLGAAIYRLGERRRGARHQPGSGGGVA